MPGAPRQTEVPFGGRQYWDPNARAVWYVPQPSSGCPQECQALTQRSGSNGAWELKGSPAVGTGAGYGYLVESTETYQHRGRICKFGAPHEENAEAETDGMDDIPELSSNTENGDSTDIPTDEAAESEDTDVVAHSILDGRWTDIRRNVVEIKDLHVKFNDGTTGALAKISDAGSGGLRVQFDYKLTFGGNEHYAKLQPGKLLWNDDDIWQLQSQVGVETATMKDSVNVTVSKSTLKEEMRLPKQLGKAEMVLEAVETVAYVADAESVRFTLVVAHRVVVTDVEAVLIQEGEKPRPVPFSKAQVIAATDSDGLVSVWIGEVPDFVIGKNELRLRVTKREWRIDPYALSIVKNAAFDDSSLEPMVLRSGAASQGGYFSFGRTSDGSGEQILAPSGPLFWSKAAKMPKAPPAFARCSDRQLVLYELHVGSFTKEGTLKAATARLDHVKALGCTAVSLMPVHQDLRRLENWEQDWWGYDVISFIGVDVLLGTPDDLAAFVSRAHALGLAVVVDYVVNHAVWGAESLLGSQYFLDETPTPWGPRPDFNKQEVCFYALAAAEMYLLDFAFDGLRVDSTKSIRKFPNDSADAAGANFLSELSSLCRRNGKLCIAEDLEDGDGVLQFGGLGFHMQWDMAMFCWVYDMLVHPMDEFRDLNLVAKGLTGLAPGRGHALRGRVIFMENHDTACSDRYGRIAAAVHNGKNFMAQSAEGGGGGDAFQRQCTPERSMPYPEERVVNGNPYAARRAAIGMALMFTAPGSPMLMQGQELGDCRPYKWPRGPAIDWTQAEKAQTKPSSWYTLCRDLIKARQRTGTTSGQQPLMGDGLHVSFCESGVLAYLRWQEPAADSRDSTAASPELALVVLNCTHKRFPTYFLGVPPSRSWRLILNTSMVAALDVETNVACPKLVPEVLLHAVPLKPNHGFPCSVDVCLPAYSAIVLMLEA